MTLMLGLVPLLVPLESLSALLVAAVLAGLATGLLAMLMGKVMKRAQPRPTQAPGKASVKIFGVQISFQAPGALGGLGVVFVLIVTFLLTLYAVLRMIPGRP